MDPFKNELIWYGVFLIAFIGFLMIGGIPNYSELAIAIIAFTISWCIVSLSIKRFGAGGTDAKSLQKELLWFGGILVAFLGLLTIVSQEDGGMTIWAYVIVTIAFSITWTVRSYAAKRFGRS